MFTRGREQVTGGHVKPGIYTDIANADYHGGAGINKGLLDVVARSPLHAKALLDQANDNGREPTPAMLLGTAFHTLLLEPHKFTDEYVEVVKVDRRTKAGKEDWAAFQQEHAGKALLDTDQMEQLLAMSHAVRQHPAASALLTGCAGVAEASVYWTDPITGELCRCRPDWWRRDGVVVDVKTTEDASPEGFAKSLATYRYHVQAPWYLGGMTAAHDAGHFPEGWERPKAFVFLAVEKRAPYAVACYVLDAESLEIGQQQMRADLDTLAECRRTGVWPGYGDTLQVLGVPQWYLMRNAHLLGAA